MLLQMRHIYGAADIRVNHIVDFYGKPVQHIPSVEETERFAGEMLAERYQQKEELLDAITRGDRAGAYAVLAKLRNYQPKRRPGCESRMRSVKDMLLSENTLYREAAYRAAVHPMYIERVFRKFSERIRRRGFFEGSGGSRQGNDPKVLPSGAASFAGGIFSGHPGRDQLYRLSFT